MIMRVTTLIFGITLIARISDSHIRYKTAGQDFLSATPPKSWQARLRVEKLNKRFVNKLSNVSVVKKRKKSPHNYTGKSFSVTKQRQWRESNHTQPRTFVVDYSILASAI